MKKKNVCKMGKRKYSIKYQINGLLGGDRAQLSSILRK